MSHATSHTSHRSASKVARLTTAVRKTWTEARSTDRELMALRTNLSRHSG